MGVRQLVEKPGVQAKLTEVDEELRQILEKRKTQIKVVGCGGAGNNTITRLMQVGIVGAETIAVNTDAMDLLYTDADKKVLIGRELTGGLGAGADPTIGMEAAKESKEDIKKALQGADMVFITCGLGGGCLRGSSLIYTNPEGPVRIDSIKPNSFVYCLENGRLVKKRVLAAMKTGVKKVFEVKTKNRTLYASYDHPFLKVVPVRYESRGRFSKFNLEWTPAELLKPGDLVVTLRKIHDFGRTHKLHDEIEFDEKFCRLFGFLLGDGWISRSKKSWKICFSPSKNKKLNQKYIRLMKEVFNLEMKRGGNWYYANSKKIYEILRGLGLGKGAREKEIPAWVFELPDSFKKEFILGLADSDGYYYRQKKKNGKEKVELRFEMSSENLIRQLKVLCDYLGLRTSNVAFRTKKIKAPNSKQKLKVTFWNLRVYKLYQLSEDLEKTREKRGIGFLYGYRGPTNSEFFRNFGFSRIKSVKPVGEEEVYDITVDGSHNFIAEGFITHNTGTGASPVVAEVAKKLGILTVGVVTLPFSMEGKQRMSNARMGLENLENLADTLIIIPNDKLLEIVPDVSLATAFKICDEILVNAVKGIAELVTKPGLVNLDFADIRAVMGEGGLAMIGMGESDTENRAFESVNKAINNPLITVDINGAKGALVDVIGGPDVTIREAQQIVEAVSSRLSPDAKIIWGTIIDKSLGDAVRTLLIVTGVKSPQIFGPEKPWTKERKKDIEKILGVDFVE
jgi:cell division protein FtsZ